MTKCAVLFCKNYSDRATSTSFSFHLFPTDPLQKREWVKAVRREQAWIPRKHSSICSIHFKPECFKEKLKQRRLCKYAVPTLNLPEFSHENKQYTRTSENTDTAKNEGTFNKPSTPVNLPGPLNDETKIQDSRRKQWLNRKTQEKNRKIKRLLHQNRCLKKKVASLKEILDNLINKSLITDDGKILLDKLLGKS